MTKFILSSPRIATKMFNSFDDLKSYISEMAKTKYKGQHYNMFGRAFRIEDDTVFHFPYYVDSVVFEDFEGYVTYYIERFNIETNERVDLED